MKLDIVKREVQQSGAMQVSVATIKATPKLFDMFENSTYADKPVAILRELVANGVDAHAMAGRRDRPVELQLPTPLDPTCSVKDYGVGMPHSFVMNEFMQYTNGSTKDQSDDQIGGLGIGSKSPFAYVDQYTLRVVHDGILSVYTMFKNEEGLPAIGLQGQTTTDELNGVEVSFPVEDADMQTFADAAQKGLQFFDPLPIVHNGTLTPPEYTYKGNGWAIRKTSGPLGVILGGIRYPVTTTSLDYVSLRGDAKLAPLLEYGLDLTLPISSCNVATSREALAYTPKTSASIRKALLDAVDDVVETFSTFFDNCSSEWEAMKLLMTETGEVSYNRSARSNLLLANAKYRGQKLETSFRVEPSILVSKFKCAVVEPRQNRRSANCPSLKWESPVELYGITPGNFETVLIDDLPDSPKSKAVAKIKAYIDDQPQAKKTLIMRHDKREVKAVLNLLREPEEYVLTSTLPEPPKAAAKIKAVRPRVRMFKFNGQQDKYTHRNITNLMPAQSKAEAVTEVAHIDQPATGIMVEMENFNLPGGFHTKMATKLVEFDDLVFVNAADAVKIKNDFERFEDIFDKRLADALAGAVDLPARLALSNDHAMQVYARWFEKMDTDQRYVGNRRPFGRMFNLWKKYIQPITPAERRLAGFTTAKLPLGVKPDALLEEIAEKQPDATILLKVLSYGDPDHRGLLYKHL